MLDFVFLVRIQKGTFKWRFVLQKKKKKKTKDMDNIKTDIELNFG